MAKNPHLTLDERAHIEVSLREGDSFTKIGRELGKDPTTISKEVKNHSQTVRKGSYNPRDEIVQDFFIMFTKCSREKRVSKALKALGCNVR